MNQRWLIRWLIRWLRLGLYCFPKADLITICGKYSGCKKRGQIFELDQNEKKYQTGQYFSKFAGST